PCRRSIRDLGRWRRRPKNTDRFAVTPLSHALLRDDNTALFNPPGDTGQPDLRALARTDEMALSAARLRVLFFVHSCAGDFVSDHREGRASSRSRLFFLRSRLRCRVLE